MCTKDEQIFELVKIGLITKETSEDGLKLIYDTMQPSGMDFLTFICKCDYWLIKKLEYEKSKKLWEDEE